MRTAASERASAAATPHRLALPLLAPTFSRLHVDADVVVCSSSGWAHGAHADGRKIVYCHTPARWLYQPDATSATQRGAARARWRRCCAGRSSAGTGAPPRPPTATSRTRPIVASEIARIYGIEAEVVPPTPCSSTPGAPRAPVGVEPGFVLCVSRLLPYKNVDAVVEAFATLPAERLVVVGHGPTRSRCGAWPART